MINFFFNFSIFSTFSSHFSYIRAWPGGTGQAKCGGNYGPTIPIQKQTMEETGCHQVLWLFNDGHEQGPLITEVGTMNFMCMWKRESDGKLELITPPLDEPEGSRERDFILPGVTRDSLLAMARSWNEFEVTEKSIEQVLNMFGKDKANVLIFCRT